MPSVCSRGPSSGRTINVRRGRRRRSAVGHSDAGLSLHRTDPSGMAAGVPVGVSRTGEREGMRPLRDPVIWTQAIQLLKTVGAAVLAWVLARHAFHIAQPFLAPWAALLTVHPTVYRTFRRGAQQVGASVVGVLLAFVVGALLGLNAL